MFNPLLSEFVSPPAALILGNKPCANKIDINVHPVRLIFFDIKISSFRFEQDLLVIN